MINASVSHEMRNPLNSIIAQNILKLELYKEMEKLMKKFDQESTKENFNVKKRNIIQKFNKIMI